MMNGFFGALVKPKKFDARKKSITDYMRLDYDKPIKLQFLNPPVKVFNHWIRGAKSISVRCLGSDNCPICARNASINYDNENPDFLKREEGYIVNALDLSLVKICPKCEFVNDKASTMCAGDECGTKLIDVDPQPLNMVRYFEGSYTLFTKIEATLISTLSESLNLKVTEELVAEYMLSVPWSIKKFKSGNNKTDYTTIPMIPEKDMINIESYADQLFDLDKVGIRMSYDEMTLLMNGVQLREIFAKRREQASEAKSELDEIFG